MTHLDQKQNNEKHACCGKATTLALQMSEIVDICVDLFSDLSIVLDIVLFLDYECIIVEDFLAEKIRVHFYSKNSQNVVEERM